MTDERTDRQNDGQTLCPTPTKCHVSPRCATSLLMFTYFLQLLSKSKVDLDLFVVKCSGESCACFGFKSIATRITTESAMELEVWSGDWGVPSVDHNCLIVMVSCEHVTVGPAGAADPSF